MIKIVFVGDEPSKTNVDPDIAFVGAKCFDRLVDWIAILKPDYYICLNSNTDNDTFKIGRLAESNFKIVALGDKASKRLSDYDVEHFKLPHPSGLNRKLNDKTYVEAQLWACKQWLTDYEKASGAV